ncbi:hypothetical protein ACHAPU_007858 [Fusarium lateritium]
MSSRTRRAAALQTIRKNRTLYRESEIASMHNTVPKRRGRPPKIRPQGKASRLRGRLPISKPRAHSRKNTQDTMSDQQIAERLDWVMRRPTMGKRVGDASRTVLQLAGQWPWDLAADFLPEKWGVEIVESLRKLFRIVHRRAATVDYGHDFQVVKDHLRESATKRDGRYPHLKVDDVTDACAHFAARNYRSDVVQTTTVKTRVRRATTAVKGDQDDQDCDDHTGGYTDNDEASSQSEWEDWIGYEPPEEDDETMRDTVLVGKRSRSSSVLSQVPKRVRTIERDTTSDEPGDLMDLDVAPSPTDHSRTVPNSTAQQSLPDLISALDSLKTKRLKELDMITCSLQEVRDSIQASESCNAQSRPSSEMIDKLCSDVKEHEIERDKILKGMKFVQDHDEDLAMGPKEINETVQQYTTRLEECDRLIAQANADVLEELEQIAQRDFDLKSKERRLRMYQSEVDHELVQYHTIRTLMKLSPWEMATLLARLEDKDISLVHLAERIYEGSDVESEP